MKKPNRRRAQRQRQLDAAFRKHPGRVHSMNHREDDLRDYKRIYTRQGAISASRRMFEEYVRRGGG